MPAPTRTGTPVSTSGYFGTGPITISTYSTHPSGDDIFVFVGHTYNAGIGTATGVTWNGASMTKVGEQQHASADVNGSLWRIAASTNTTGDIVVTLPGSSDFIGTVAVFSANNVGSIGTLVKNTFSFAGTAGVTTTVTDGTTNSLILGMSVARRNGTNTTLAAFTVTSGGADIANTGSSTAGQNYDRTCVFTEAGAASVALDLTYAFDSDRIVMMGLALNGGGGGTLRRRPQLLTTRRARVSTVSRIVTRTWAGPPVIPSIPIGPTPDASSGGFSRRRTAAFARKGADYVNRRA